MPTLKNHLVTTFNDKNIPRLVEYTTANYRPFDPGQYLYKLITEISNKAKFSDKFIELTYTTLIAWNMNQRGAKLSDFDIFRESLLENKSMILSLKKYKIESSLNIDLLTHTIKSLFQNLNLVAIDKPKLVSISKTLHFFLPDLFMPIDRSYTIKFFYRNTNIHKDYDKQFEIYMEIFKEFNQLSINYDFNKHKDKGWNRNIPKIIDNIIIAYIKEQTT
jgi:hypothetical protein